MITTDMRMVICTPEEEAETGSMTMKTEDGGILLAGEE
jgi:hypothetical protein